MNTASLLDKAHRTRQILLNNVILSSVQGKKRMNINMNFKPIECTDKEAITAYTYETDIPICDFSFSNLYGWSFLYKTSWAVIADHLVIRFYRTHNASHPLYLFPIGKEADTDKLDKAMQSLAAEADRGGYPLTFMGITPQCHEWMQKTYPDRFTFFADRDWNDYVYLREKLADLSGKKLQSRRNYVNRFRASFPDYTFEEITEINADECLQLALEWNESKAKAQKAQDEIKMIERVIKSRECIGLYGGAIRLGGKIIAFSMGMPINRKTFGLSIEKADASIAGAFAIINNEMAKHIPQQYTYINREEDLGIEGLRQAKLQYKPEVLLSKETAILRTGNLSMIG
ncbi:MAG: phosphatidylglycerol lysyltransferase domain-containing protein [Porphyromonas sp.]|nr:phosphatidylglycerol lysyltransferase domain-containing protein [Porphyromonas sp.]